MQGKAGKHTKKAERAAQIDIADWLVGRMRGRVHPQNHVIWSKNYKKINRFMIIS